MTSDVTKWKVGFEPGSGRMSQFVEAESWHINEDGTLVFTTVSPYNSAIVSPVSAFAAGAWHFVRAAVVDE